MSTILERRRLQLGQAKAAAMQAAEQPKPKAFPSGGPRSMQFCAYDPDRFDVCGDPDCSCRSSRNNTRGFGATEQEAIADYWLNWEEKHAEQLEQMRISDLEHRTGERG